jgi:hypothetical protein
MMECPFINDCHKKVSEKYCQRICLNSPEKCIIYRDKTAVKKLPREWRNVKK